MEEFISLRTSQDMELADALGRYIRQHGTITFADIERFLEHSGILWHGNEKIFITGHNDVVLWGGLSPRAADIIRTVIQEDDFEIRKTHKTVYLMQGRMMQMPETTAMTLNNSIPSWCPAVIRTKKEVVMSAV